ncbi:hypothetical protein [Nonomuraea insulae]|uniref:Uncharacterized protein n=1 Tax=Nonomuraea insulae TaxID=1616787 RepID=A0ABW1D2Q0_9ACTN
MDGGGTDNPVQDGQSAAKPQVVVVDGVKVLQVPLDPPTAEVVEDMLQHPDRVPPAEMPNVPAGVADATTIGNYANDGSDVVSAGANPPDLDALETVIENHRDIGPQDMPGVDVPAGEYGKGDWAEQDVRPDGPTGSVDPARPSTGAGQPVSLPPTDVTSDGVSTGEVAGAATTPADDTAPPATDDACDSDKDATPGGDTGTTPGGKDTTPAPPTGELPDQGTGGGQGTGQGTGDQGGQGTGDQGTGGTGTGATGDQGGQGTGGTGGQGPGDQDGQGTGGQGAGGTGDQGGQGTGGQETGDQGTGDRGTGDQGTGERGKPVTIPPTNPSAETPNGATTDTPPTTTDADGSTDGRGGSGAAGVQGGGGVGSGVYGAGSAPGVEASAGVNASVGVYGGDGADAGAYGSGSARDAGAALGGAVQGGDVAGAGQGAGTSVAVEGGAGTSVAVQGGAGTSVAVEGERVLGDGGGGVRGGSPAYGILIGYDVEPGYKTVAESGMGVQGWADDGTEVVAAEVVPPDLDALTTVIEHHRDIQPQDMSSLEIPPGEYGKDAWMPEDGPPGAVESGRPERSA